MNNFELINQGAEARLYKGSYLGKPALAKERFVKKYRHKYLDDVLTKDRIKAETRAIVKCKTLGIRTPSLYFADIDRRIIIMEYFENSITMKDFIEKSSMETVKKLSYQLGIILGQMHAGNVIHGDLTSSNILLVNENNEDNFDNINSSKIVLIDFGLAHIDTSAEDKGVDLYVLERALISTHATGEGIFTKILEGYGIGNTGFKEIFTKYKEVRARGRKRTMIG